tara:strand:+ start:430 stop:1449 length:1020 start_codon:yes stop_codon:yes gene_type:complete
MDTKVALFFLLDSSKAATPQNYGMQLPVEKVVPLYESLNATSRFAKINFPDSTVYGFSFFKKPFQTEMLVVLRDLNHGGRKKFEAQCSAQLAKLLDVNEPFHYADYVHQALWLPRGLQKEEFLTNLRMATGESEPALEGVTRKYIGDSWVMNYRRGYIFGGKSETEFCRSLALYGLGLAYHRQLSLMTDRLAQSVELGGDQLNGAKLDGYRFSSHFLFDNPVRPAHTDVFESYQHISKGLHLDQVEAQFRKKLEDLAQFVRIKRSRDQIDGGWVERFRGENRQPTEDKPKNTPKTIESKSGSSGLLWVLLLVAGLVAAAGYLGLAEQPLALLRSLLESS